MAVIDLPKAIGLVEKNSIDYIRAAFNVLESGGVVVPLKSAKDFQRLAYLNVSEAVEPSDSSGWFEASLDLADSDDIGHISFTSGTEGRPKGAFISYTALNNTVSRLQSLMQMDSTAREYIGVPVYHSFGYGRCRHVASVGGSFYIPSQGFDPKELSQMLAQGEVNALSLVPSLLRILLNQPDLLGDERKALKWLEIGSQAMSAVEKQAVKKLFPNAKIVQHYGLTEASRTTLLPIDEVDESLLDSVGTTYDDSQIHINEKGRICIKGSHMASHMLVDGIKVSIGEGASWFETSDVGSIKDGYLYFEGRADNIVNCGGQKLSTEKFESALNKKINITGEFAVSRIPDKNYGEGFLISCIEKETSVMLKSIAGECLQELGVAARSALQFFIVDEIPKTHTGKVQHKILVQQFTDSVHTEKSESQLAENDDQELLSIFSKALNISASDLNVDDSVVDIGVDSLQSVQLSIYLERALGYLPQNWRDLSISQLSYLPRKARIDKSTSSESRKAGKARPLWDGSSNMNPQDISFWALVKEDFNTHERDLFSQGFFAMFTHRFGNWRMGIKTKILRAPMTLVYALLRKMTQVFCGIKLDYTVHVGRRVKLEHFGGMIIGARSIGDDTIIRQNTTMGIRDMSDLSAKPTIEEGVNIGVGAVIVGDIVVGRHSVIGPNCVITEDLPPFSVVSAAKPIVITGAQ